MLTSFHRLSRFINSLQLGTAALLSLTSTIQVAFPEKEGDTAPSQKGYKVRFPLRCSSFGPLSFASRSLNSSSFPMKQQYGFIFCMGIMTLDGVLVFIFFKDPLALVAENATKEDATADPPLPVDGKPRGD